MGDPPVDLVRITDTGYTEYLTIRESEFRSGRHFRRGFATYDSLYTTLQDMFYGQMCDLVFHKKFDTLPAARLKLLAHTCHILKDTHTEVIPGLTVPYGAFLEKYKKTGWELNTAFRLPYFRFNSRAAKREAMDELRDQDWWKPKRSVAYATALAINNLLPVNKPELIEALREPWNYPNPMYDFHHSRIEGWIRKANPDYCEAMEQYLNSDDPKKKDKGLNMLFWLLDTGNKYYWKVHKIKEPKPVVSKQELEEQQRPHKKKARY